MAENNFSPITKLTTEVIDKMIIHQTQSSLDRAGAISPCIKRVEGDSTIPTLYYIQDSKSNKWSIHALQVDISRYLLLTTLNGDVPEPPTEAPTEEPTEEPTAEPAPKIHSSIRWDGVTGGKLSEYVDGGILILNGEIEWSDDEDPAGNYVCALITPDRKMLEYYPEATVTEHGITKKVSQLMEGASFAITCRIFTPGQETPIEVKWSNDFIEHFIIAVTQESVLKS